MDKPRHLRMVRCRRVKKLSLPSIDAMTPGDLLSRLAVVSPDTYRAVITIARERFKALWTLPTDVLDELRTGTHR